MWALNWYRTTSAGGGTINVVRDLDAALEPKTNILVTNRLSYPELNAAIAIGPKRLDAEIEIATKLTTLLIPAEPEMAAKIIESCPQT